MWVPNVDIFVAPSGDLMVCVELSGMEHRDFEIKMEGTTLQIRGERASTGLSTAQTVLVHEINAGPFESVIDVPPTFNLARASSVYENGTLRVTVPAF